MRQNRDLLLRCIRWVLNEFNSSLQPLVLQVLLLFLRWFLLTWQFFRLILELAQAQLLHPLPLSFLLPHFQYDHWSRHFCVHFHAHFQPFLRHSCGHHSCAHHSFLSFHLHFSLLLYRFHFLFSRFWFPLSFLSFPQQPLEFPRWRSPQQG